MQEELLGNRSILAFMWAHRRAFLPGLSCALGRILVIAPFPLLFQNIIDHRMPTHDVRGIVGIFLAVVAMLFVHHWLFVRGSVRLAREASEIILQLRGVIFNKIQFLSFAYLDRQQTGRLLSKYAFDTQKVEAVMMPILNNFIPDALFSLLTFIILVSMNWQLAIVLVLMMPILSWMRAYYFKRFAVQHEESRRAQEKLTGTAAEWLSALRLVRSYAEEGQAETQLLASNREVAKSRVRLMNISSSFASFGFASVKVLSLIVIAGGAVLAIYGQISTGAVIAFVAGVPALVNPIQMFAQISDQYFIGQEAYNSIKELVDTPYVEGWEGEQTAARMHGQISFDGVSFAYEGKERGALHDFNLEIRAGEKVALVGPSGAGKSTIASLILGLYRPVSGTIRIDGVPQADLDMRWFRRQTAIVMQESILLSGTIEENIRFARNGATREEVREAARLAHAEEFILKLPDGYETKIGERGATLSGGQRQRLAIARAVLRNPAILILDEPTSALDFESERLIQDALETLAEGRTVITIAHRVSTVRDVDRVIVLEEGRLVEQGSFDDIARRSAYFSGMVKAQGAGSA
jgi:ATP-binding cassette subfamily B protein